jgi:Mor family transcriptional regulator
MGKVKIPDLPGQRIKSTMVDALVGSGLNDEISGELAEDLLRGLIEEFAGQLFYVSAPMVQKAREERDRKMFESYRSGTDINTLARQYGVTSPQVLRIVGAQQKLAEKQQQIDLFEGGA